MIAVVDCNVGNLFSVINALEYIGEKAEITRFPDVVRKSDAIILPGDGAFAYAMEELEKTGLIEVIREETAKKPLLGICVGMQMLFEDSYEFTHSKGLGFLAGEINKIPENGLKIPHMGWNSLKFLNPDPLLDGVDEGSYVYFVHSYMAFTPDENITAYCEYGSKIPAMVRKGNIFGTQFHPEKSSEAGLTMLRNFGRLVR
jgi:glutamine amidotransferase